MLLHTHSYVLARTRPRCQVLAVLISVTLICILGCNLV